MELDWSKARGYLQGLNVGAETDSPLVRWSILVILLILFWVWLIEPLQKWRSELDEKAARDAEVAVRLAALQESAAEWTDAYREAEAALEAAMPLYFLEQSDTAAQAVMQQLLSNQARLRGVQVESSKLIEAEIVPKLGSRLGIAMNLRGELVAVLQLLDDISRANHVVVIDRWQMRRERNNVISAQITVSGFRPGEAE